ncbi:hypothetical protein GQ53DRAFT_519195 [Thozetella sp. PMI_491]|nr:hypothetical protein GQ53DRAFT_519195 [Thozetella sp. PMI_491]
MIVKRYNVTVGCWTNSCTAVRWRYDAGRAMGRRNRQLLSCCSPWLGGTTRKGSRRRSNDLAVLPNFVAQRGNFAGWARGADPAWQLGSSSPSYLGTNLATKLSYAATAARRPGIKSVAPRPLCISPRPPMSQGPGVAFAFWLLPRRQRFAGCNVFVRRMRPRHARHV